MRLWPRRRSSDGPRHPKGRPFPTRDGTWVRSFGEQRIADVLSRRGLAYEYEPPLLGFRPDFVLPQPRIVIEYWGGAGFRRYQDQMVRKTAAYEGAGYRVVHLVPLHLRDIERVLVEELEGHGVL